MSISAAPSLHGVLGFGDLGHGGVRAQRKSDDGAYLDRRSGQFGGGQRHPIWIDADAGEAVFTGLAADFANVGCGRVGAQQRVIDLRGERRIDVRQRLAGGNTGGSGGENLAVIGLRRRSFSRRDIARGSPRRFQRQAGLARLVGRCPLQVRLIDFLDFVDARGVTAARERRREPRAKHLFGLGGAQQTTAQRQDVGIVVFPAVSCGSSIITQGCAHSRKFIGDHGGADSSAVDDDAPGCRAAATSSATCRAISG